MAPSGKRASPVRVSPDATASTSQHASPSPSNVFSNDGSFMARFQQRKAEQSCPQEISALKRKREMEERIRNRGKRRASNLKGEEEAPTGKQSKAEEDKDSYLEEVRKLESSSLKDKGAGVRALVK